MRIIYEENLNSLFQNEGEKNGLQKFILMTQYIPEQVPKIVEMKERILFLILQFIQGRQKEMFRLQKE